MANSTGPRPSGVLGGALLFAGMLVLASCGDDEPSTNGAEGADPEAVVGAYFEAFNAGDADAVLSLMSTDATVASGFGSGPVDFVEEADGGEWEKSLAWATAQGTVLTAPSCTVADDQPADGMTFSCDYETLDAPTQAVDALPIPTTTSFTITSLRISDIQQTFNPSNTGVDFLHVGRPFHGWLAANHPDLTCLAVSERSASCDNWAGSFTSVEKATEQGQLVPQYAQEWAAYLEENGCTYLDSC